MKHESRTIGQSRTWARELLGRLEREWEPPVAALLHYQYCFKVVRETRERTKWTRWAIWCKYLCGRKKLIERMEKALAELLKGKEL